MEACATARIIGRARSQRSAMRFRLMPRGLCEGLCAPPEERRCGRGGDLRGGHPANHALRPRSRALEQQGVLVLHRTRELLVRQRTMLINAHTGALR